MLLQLWQDTLFSKIDVPFPLIVSRIIMCGYPCTFLALSIAKEIAIFDGDITNFIPEEIKKEVYDRLYINKDNGKSQ